MNFARHAIAATVAILFLFSGCSNREPTYPVTGKVLYKDDQTPAAVGVAICFESTQPPYTRAMGEISPDGSFTLSTDRPDNGAMRGEHRVCILPLATDGSAMNLTETLSKSVDPKYFDYGSSGLKFDIQPSGKNEFVIEVDRPPGSTVTKK